jgi:hypothetical protein
MSRLDSAGKFQARGIKNKVVRKLRKGIRSGPVLKIDERVRAGVGAKPVSILAERMCANSPSGPSARRE